MLELGMDQAKDLARLGQYTAEYLAVVIGMLIVGGLIGRWYANDPTWKQAARIVVGAWLICIFWLSTIWVLPIRFSYSQEHPIRWASFAFDLAFGAAVVLRFVLGADTRAWLRSQVR